jgi:hypothetical protein
MAKGRLTGHGHCAACDKDLPVEVLSGAGGYYIGLWCDTCGPYGRISGYYGTLEQANKALADGSYVRSTGGE